MSSGSLFLPLHFCFLVWRLKRTVKASYQPKLYITSAINIQKNIVLLLFFDQLAGQGIKVRIFWEGHKILQNLYRRFVLCKSTIILKSSWNRSIDSSFFRSLMPWWLYKSISRNMWYYYWTMFLWIWFYWRKLQCFRYMIYIFFILAMIFQKHNMFWTTDL